MRVLLRIAVLGLIAIPVLVMLLAGIGAGYELYNRARALSEQTAPGQLVDVGGHRLHIVCTGQAAPGGPTVVLESGVGGWSLQWSAVQEQIAAFARVCAYDRAGMGWSQSGPQPRDGRQIATELHTLLTNAGEAGPYVLVGASRGGQYVRLFADLFPHAVVGLVLVDAEPEGLRERSSFAAAVAAQNQSAFASMAQVARFGIVRLLGAYNPGPGGDIGTMPQMPCLPHAVTYLPAELHAQYLAVEGQPRCFEAVLAEDAASPARAAQMRAIENTSDVPVIILTHGLPEPPPGAESVPGADEYETIWQELQRELAAQLPNATLIVAENSGHDIMVDQPELVVASVRQLVERQ